MYIHQNLVLMLDPILRFKEEENEKLAEESVKRRERESVKQRGEEEEAQHLQAWIYLTERHNKQ